MMIPTVIVTQAIQNLDQTVYQPAHQMQPQIAKVNVFVQVVKFSVQDNVQPQFNAQIVQALMYQQEHVSVMYVDRILLMEFVKLVLRIVFGAMVNVYVILDFS